MLPAQKVYKLEDIATRSARIEVLDLSNEALTELPPDVFKCKKIKKLIAKNNLFTFLPHWLSDLKQLEVIDLSNNKNLNVKQVFSELAGVERLVDLILNDCKLFYLPTAIRRLKHLKKVSLANNQIKYLPPIFEFVHWETLDLSYNCIDTLPNSMVFLSTLKQLDLSYTPATANKKNFYILSHLKALKTLDLSGVNVLLPELGKLYFIEDLIVRFGSFAVLPNEIGSLRALNRVDFRGCANLPISDIVEALADLPFLTKLKVGFNEMNTLPFNLSKLKRISYLQVDGACFDKLSSSFAKYKGSTIVFSDCKFSDPLAVFEKLGSAKRLTDIVVVNSFFAKRDWFLGECVNLKNITFKNCGLSHLPIKIERLPKIEKIDLRGNRIPVNTINWSSPKPLLSFQYSGVTQSLVPKKLNKYVAKAPEIRRTIYPEVGDFFDLPSGAKVEVPAGCFITTGNKVVEGDVELRIAEYSTYKDFLKTYYPTYLNADEVAEIGWAVELQAFHNGKEVFIAASKPIVITPQMESNEIWTSYRFLNYKAEWVAAESDLSVCDKSKAAILNTGCSFEQTIPKPNYKLKTARVFIKLQKRKRKGVDKLNFEITPEYGYRDQNLNPFGDKIKGYPDLKYYKGIRWRYVGDSLEEDLRRLYFLSEEAQVEKLKKYNNLKGYSLDIKDIRIFPNPDDDNYLIQFIEGRDTFAVKALPFISLYKAKKIQRWHKVKYKRYKKAYVKRKEKWLRLDTNYLSHYDAFEVDLEKYRLLHLPAVNYKTVVVQPKLFQSVLIVQPGLYQLAKPLLVGGSALKSPLLFINQKRFYPQKVLVTNLSNGYSFWSAPKDIAKEKGLYKISVNLNGVLYSGIWGVTNRVDLKKIDED